MKSLYENLLSSDSVVPISRLVLKMLDGDYQAAALLSQCVYWSKRTKDAEGWFAKTYQEWHEELALTRKHLERAVKRLQQLCLETRVARSPYHRYVPCTFYRIDFDRLHEAIQSFLEQSECAEKDAEQPGFEDQNGESVQTGLYSECKPDCTPGTSSLHYTKNYSKDLDTYMRLHDKSCKRIARDDESATERSCSKAKKEDARTAKAKELLAAYRRVRYPTQPSFRESEFKMYRNALYALVDDHRTVDEVERATRAALERFSSRTMVNLNSLARHIEALLEANSCVKHSHSAATETYEESLRQQDDLIRRALRDNYDAYFHREEREEDEKTER